MISDIQAVLIDVMMPNMGGIAAIRTLREIDPQVKIIATSGLSSKQEPAFAAGANLFLPKPFILGNLLENLGTLIASKRPERQ